MKLVFTVAVTILRLTHDPAEDRAPVWAPDGSQLAFQSDRDGEPAIFMIRADGTGLERLSAPGQAATYPAWSPDGSHVAFQSRGGLWIMDLDTREERRILDDPAAELTPDWSPDGERIAFTSDRAGSIDLWTVPASGGEPTRVTTSSYRDVWPRWSPDGASILFFSRRDTDGERDELYVLDWATREVERVTVNPTHHDFSPDWSPSGERIVTALSDSEHDRALVIYDRSGRQLERFAEGYHRVFQPAWSPDGSTIAYAARVEDGANADIYLAPVTEREDSRPRR